MSNCFNNDFYFPDKNREKYNKHIEKLLFTWLQKFLETSSNEILNRDILQSEKEKDEMVNFLLKQTKQLLNKVLKQNNNTFHRKTIKSIFIVCFFITYKTYTGIDYETLYRKKDQTCCCNLNLRCLSKAIPENDDEKNIKRFKKIEIDIMENFDWKPFKLTTA